MQLILVFVVCKLVGMMDVENLICNKKVKKVGFGVGEKCIFVMCVGWVEFVVFVFFVLVFFVGLDSMCFFVFFS